MGVSEGCFGDLIFVVDVVDLVVVGCVMVVIGKEFVLLIGYSLGGVVFLMVMSMMLSICVVVMIGVFYDLK